MLSRRRVQSTGRGAQRGGVPRSAGTGVPGPGGGTQAHRPPPRTYALSPGAQGVRLDWTDTSTNEGGFRVMRAGQPIGTVPPNITTFTDPAAIPTVPTCYAVVAFNPFGQAQSNQACTSPL